MSNAHWINCEKCGKRLVKRYPNGIFHFSFGRVKDDEGKIVPFEHAVDIKIYGSLEMRCFRKDCKHINIINFLPIPIEDNPKK